ncbi:MAG: hypothetical protein ACJAUP_002543 [Cellvibrionaceae bacterium]|jgi:hypothetical protein
MAPFKLTRRDLVSGILKGAFSIPFALSPMGRLAYGQSAPTDTPLRLITITIPYSANTETDGESYSDNHFTNIMWNQFPPTVRPYTRFFSKFSYNIRDTANWHGFGGFGHLFTCNPLPSDRGDSSDQPRSVSMDYEIASLMGSYYAPYANMQTSASGAILNSIMPITLMSHAPLNILGEYKGSESIYYPPTTGSNVFDTDTNFGCFLTYRPNGTVKNPLYPNTANAYSSIFGIQNSGGDPLPETGLEQVLDIIHGSDISNFITQKQLQGTLESNDKVLDLQRRISKHQDYLSAQRNPPSGGSCDAPQTTWPLSEQGTHHDARNAYNIASITQMISCDLHRVINFSFADADATGMDGFTANGLPDIDFHNATHREFGGIDVNNGRMRSIYDYYYQQVGLLLDELQQMEDPLAPGTGQNVLDNTVVYITGTTGFPDVHSANQMAIAVVGGGRRLGDGSNLLPLINSGSVSEHIFDGTGAYPDLGSSSSSLATYAGTDRVANLQLSILRLFGSTRNSWGREAGPHYTGSARAGNDARSNGANDLINFTLPGTFEQYRSS